MKFLANINKIENHLTTITENLKVHDQAFFAVAFLKTSGLNNLALPIKDFLKLGGQLIIVAGQNFTLTEPIALHELRNLFKLFPTSKLFLAKANAATNRFHQKLYLFKLQKECCVISGSASITKGGHIDNQETSIIADCIEKEKIWFDAKKYCYQILA